MSNFKTKGWGYATDTLADGGTVTGDITLNDNINLKLGTGGDSVLDFDGTDTVWNLRAVGTGDLLLTGNVLVTGQIGSNLGATLIPTGTTQTIDWEDGNAQVLDLGSATGDVTLTLSNPVSGFSYQLKIIQGATARDVVLPASVLLSNGTTAPHTLDPNTVDNSISLLTLTYYGDGSHYLASFDAGEYK